MTPLETALDLAARGLSVIPIPRPGVSPGADGKVPAIAWKEFQTRQPTTDELRRWFAYDQNLAIITGGVSGIVVVDADSPEAIAWIRRRLPYTPWQTKTARGFHLFYGHPGVPVRNRARLDTGDGKLALDVRADAGYVIAPGSLHASGIRYEFAGDWTVPKDRLPTFWPGWIQRAPRAPAPPPLRPRPTGDLVERARRYLRAIPRPVEGQGSDVRTLIAAARLVRGFELPEADAVGLLGEWAPDFDREWLQHKVANAARYGTEPIGGLR